jgi:hypothetical protein
MRPYGVRVHSKERHGNECAVPSKPEDGVPELERFSVLLSVVLMEINI